MILENFKDLDISAPQPFRFLSLPAELRLLVYEFALQTNRPVGIIQRRSPKWGLKLELKRKNDICVPALLFTNRQIHYESKKIIYDNHFELAGRDLLTFLDSIGDSEQLIDRVTWRYQVDQRREEKWADDDRLWRWVCDTDRVKRLVVHSMGAWNDMHVRLSYPMSGSPIHQARVFFKEMKPWLKAVAKREGSVLAALDMIAVDAESIRGDRGVWMWEPDFLRMLKWHVERDDEEGGWLGSTT